MRQMRALLKDHPLGPLDPALDCLGNQRRGLIVAPRSDQGRRVDFAQPRGDIPIFDHADHMEFAGAVHGVIDLRPFAQLGKSALDIGGIGYDAANIAVVENLHGGQIFAAVGGAGGFMGG